MESSKRKNLAVVVGARPNFIKAAPFLLRGEKYPEFKFIVIHTGQHFDANMSKIFFDEMAIPQPDIMLTIKGEFHTEKLGKMFNALGKVFKENKFDGVIVFGDVNSTLAGAIAATKNNYPLIHIEAGLRSHDRRMPEEINRVVVDHLSDLLFTTEAAANENLLKEGIEPDRIKFVGNIMIESIEIFWDRIQASDIVDVLKLNKKKFIVATIHRQENTDSKDNLKTILSMINLINKAIPVVFPLHPGTKQKINDYGLEDLLANLNVINPLGYFEFIKLIADSLGIITDSGGIQDETSYLGIPCCTLRDNTERPITVELGSNKLFGVNLDNVEEILGHLYRSNFKPKHIPLWDDKTSERILDCLK